MTKEEEDLAKEAMQDGWKFVMNQGALIAMFPIEDWLQAFEKAEAIGLFIDPTLYRDYLYSGKGKVIKDVLSAALTFKRAIVKAQEQVKANPRLQQ